ncbi:tetratricopeptide repeat protein [Exiguobacterium alkaliphilum]|uniref:tetratricopeptide repeat protein n=1 Tax=Exiguobacterium alkaliphilum TaxID=1428684 RepID=UPI001BAADC42|nr:tetratricopeptide repeat protein [Exiguobacterium alkaliphilum]QUE86290.1 tetratricopeptide repeat protein [Exiguobacterium alkaliphilum]
MEYNYGNLIKVERMRKNMKQTVLARGICSVSYLSKIENNQTSPSEEVLELIFERLELQVPLYFDFSNQVDKVKEDIRNILKEAILNRNDNAKRKDILKFIEHPAVKQSKTLYVTLMLTLARFGIMPGGDAKYITEVSWIEDQLSRDDDLRYTLIKALQMFQKNEKQLAFDLVEKLNELLPGSGLPDWEIADMRYIMGGLYYKFTDNIQALENVKFALTYFQENFCLERIVECHLIIGLSYKRRKRYSDALSHYQKAIKVISATDLKNYYGMLYNNMGEIYSLLGDQDKALQYFIESFEYKIDIRSKLYSVLSLIEVNSNQENEEGVLHWLSVGYELMENENEVEEFNRHFDIYQNHFKEKNIPNLIESLKKAVNYFETHDEYMYTKKYALWLAKELRENGKYKLATEYYEKVISIMSQSE